MAEETLSKETISLIHLNLIQGIGLKTVQRLRRIFGTTERALQATPDALRKTEHLSPHLCDLLIRKPVVFPIEKELELIHRYGCRVITLYDADYPEPLKQIGTPPLVLYVRGELRPEDALSISFVGSRQANAYGRKVGYRLSYQLAQRGFTVISGFAKGIDSIAHRAACEAGGRTLAVMGHGLSMIYPAENRELAEKIAASGALISEFPMTAKPLRQNFPRRNRIISGLSLGTVVVEASRRSGALITARHAAEQNREVFAVPGDIHSELSRGTHQLINEGAKLIHTVEDLLSELPPHVLNRLPSHPTTPRATSTPEPPDEPAGVDTEPQRVPQQEEPRVTPPAPPSPPPNLTPDEQTVYDAIAMPTTHIDTIVRATQLPIGQVSSVLLMLELKGAVRQLPGKQFAKGAA